MAKTFGQYTGGIQAIQGINEFGAAQAAGIERTMGGLANTITKTYDTLNQQEEENASNKELIKGQSGNLAAIKKLMDANPDTKDSPLSQSITEMIAKLDSAGDLNRGQLKGLLKSSEVFTSQLPLTMQLQDKAFLAQTTAGVNTALEALKKQTVKDSKGYDVPVPSFQGGSPEKYQRDLQTFFEQHKKDNPEVQLDIGKAVRDSVQLQIQKFTNDPDLRKADPTYQQHLIRGFEALGKRDAEIPDAALGNEDDVYKAMDEAAAADRLSGQAPADIRRGELASQALEAQRKAGNLPPVAGTPQFDANGLDANGFNRQGNRPITAQKRYENATKYLGSEKTKAETSVADLTKELDDTSQRMSDLVLKQGKGGTAEHKKAVERYEEIKNTLLPDAKQAVKDTSSAVAEHAKDKEAFLKRWFDPKLDLPTRAEDEINAAKQLTAEGKYTAMVGVKTDRYEKRYLEELLADVKNGGYVGFGDRLSQMIIGNERLAQEVMRDKEVEQQGWFGVGSAATIEATAIPNKRREELVDWIRDLRTKQDLGVLDSGKDMRPAQKLAVMRMLEERIGGIDKRLANPVAVKDVTPAEASAKAAGIVANGETPITKEAPKPDMYAMGFDYKMTIPGVFVNERPLTYDEEKAGIRKWFEENHNGVVPSTIDAIYKTVRPEAALTFAKGPNGENLMHTDKGWVQMTQLTQPKGMTSEEQSDETLFKFGQTVQGRRIPKEAVEGSGIMVNGNFGGGKKRAEAFAQNLQDVATLNESIPALIEMFKKPGHSIGIINQKEHGIAMSHLAKIRAAIRVETVGTGPVALPEHEMINKRLGDPNATLTFDKTEISKLNEILNTAKTNLQRQGVGLQITFRPPSKNGQNPIQQNRVANAANRSN
jgi:hypothetical protein